MKWIGKATPVVLIAVGVSCSESGPSGLSQIDLELASAQPQTSAVYWGPVTVTRQAGAPLETTWSVPDLGLEHFEGQLRLRVVNGDAEGNHRASSVTIRIGDVMVVAPHDLSQAVGELEREVSIGAPTSVTIRMASAPESEMRVWIEGNLRAGHGRIGSEGGTIEHPSGALVVVEPDSFPVPAWVVVAHAPDNVTGLNVAGPSVNVALALAHPTLQAGMHASSLAESLLFSYEIQLPIAGGFQPQYVEGTITPSLTPEQTYFAIVTRIIERSGRVDLAVRLHQRPGASLTIQPHAVETGTCSEEYKLVEAEGGSAESDAVPVVVIHGWQPLIGTCSTWRSNFELSEQGAGLLNAIKVDEIASRISLWRFTYPSYNSIEAAAAHLANAISHRWPTGRVVLIGHSMGGLVARASVEMNGLGDRVRVVTLATPHRGSPLAIPLNWLGVVGEVLGTDIPLVTDGARDLNPASGENFIARLNGGAESSTLGSYYTFGGSVDALTFLPTSAPWYAPAVLFYSRLGITSDAIVPLRSALLEGTIEATDFGTGYDHSEMLGGNYDGTKFPCLDDDPCEEPLFQRIIAILRDLVPPAGFFDDFSQGLGNWEIKNVAGGLWFTQQEEDNYVLIGDYGIGCGTVNCHHAQLVLHSDHMPAGDWRAEIDAGLVQAYCCVNGGVVANFAKFALWVSNSEKEAFNVGGWWANLTAPASMNTVNVAHARYPWNELANFHVTVPQWQPAEWQRVALEKRGNTYTLFFNGTQVYSVTRTFTSPPRIAFSTYGRVRQDNFSIRSLTPTSTVVAAGGN